MSLIYVTGAPGVGKSALQQEFSTRGYDARDIDSPDLGGPHNKASGELVEIPPANDRTPEWFDTHEWRVYPDIFEKLKTEARNKDILIFGVASRDDAILHIFDRIIYLNVGDDTLIERITNRAGNDFGKNDFELEEILNRKHELDETYSLLDVTDIDADKSLHEVAEEIVSHLR